MKQRAWYRLSAAGVANFNAPGKKLHDGGGLYLLHRRSGTKDWLLKFQRGGRPRGMGLGGYPATGLAEARAKADAARKVLAAEADPIDHRRAERRRQTAEAAQLKSVAEVVRL